MQFLRITDNQAPLPQTPEGCGIACAAMGLRAIHGMPAREVYDDLYKLLSPQMRGGIALPVLAQTIQHRYRVTVQAGRHVDLAEVLALGRVGALTIGVRPSVLYSGVREDALHAVYVAATEHSLDEVPGLPKAWQPHLNFAPPPDIIDPAPPVLGRRSWTVEDLRLAFTGDWLLIRSR